MRTKTLLASALAVLVFVSGCDLFPWFGSDGESFVVGSDGGTINFTNPENEAVSVQLVIPPGSVPDGTTITIATADSEDYPDSTDLLPSTAFAFAPDGLTFGSAATLTITYDESELAGRDEAGLAIHRGDNTSWTEVPGSVNATQDEVSASINGFSFWALIWRLLCSGTSEGSASSPLLTNVFAPHSGEVGTCADSYYVANVTTLSVGGAILNPSGDVDLYVYSSADFSGTPVCSSTNAGTANEECYGGGSGVSHVRVVNNTSEPVTFTLVLNSNE